MKSQADKSQENQRHAIANDSIQQQVSTDDAFQFVDNRAETAQLRQLQAIVDNSPQVKGLVQLQTMVDNSFRPLVLRQTEPEDEELLQGQFVFESTTQLAQQSVAKQVDVQGEYGIVQRIITINNKPPKATIENQVDQELESRNVSGKTQRQVQELLADWIAAPGPEDNELTILRATQNKNFGSVKELVTNLLQHIQAEPSRRYDESEANNTLESMDEYAPLLEKLLSKINEYFNQGLKKNKETIIRYLKAKKPYGPLAQTLIYVKGTPSRFDMAEYMKSQHVIERFYKAFSIIHHCAILLMKEQIITRPNIEEVVGGQYRKKGSKYDLEESNPEITMAREEGISLWAGFSGSTADVLTLGNYFGLEQNEINSLAELAVLFFQIMPTDKSSTHTLHEVMTVANKLFNVPYQPFKLFPINLSKL